MQCPARLWRSPTWWGNTCEAQGCHVRASARVANGRPCHELLVAVGVMPGLGRRRMDSHHARCVHVRRGVQDAGLLVVLPGVGGRPRRKVPELRPCRRERYAPTSTLGLQRRGPQSEGGRLFNGVRQGLGPRGCGSRRSPTPRRGALEARIPPDSAESWCGGPLRPAEAHAALGRPGAPTARRRACRKCCRRPSPS